MLLDGTLLADGPADDYTLGDLTLYGYKSDTDAIAARIGELVIDAEVTRTIDGAPTLEVMVEDETRQLAGAGAFSYRIVYTLNEVAFELAAVRKDGDVFTLVFEDVRVAEMRRRATYRKIGAGQMSRVEFGYLLISELPPVDFVTPPITLEVSKVELARGRENLRIGQTPEDTWKCLSRIYGDVHWRFWTDRGRVFTAPDTYLISLPEAAHLRENVGAVNSIDYEVDTNKTVQRLTFDVVSDLWALPIGARIVCDEPGPSNGNWIVTEYRRSLLAPMATVTAATPTVPLPEPTQDTESAGGSNTGRLPQTGATTTPGTTESFKAYARRKALEVYGWGDDEFVAIDEIWTAESGWDPTAQNPNSTAFGIAQFLDPTWGAYGYVKTDDPYGQIDAGLAYLHERYGTPLNALAFRRIKGWY